MTFTAADYERLYNIVFRSGYPGYRPEVRELPNGDGRIDADKRYAHVAVKYLDQMPMSPDKGALVEYSYRAFELALQVSHALGVPKQFVPKYEFCALRVLEYPLGAASARHTDFDLFTLLMHRDQRNCLQFFDGDRDPWELDDIHEGLHIGEMGELIGLGPATAHEVLPSTTTQRSIVYFAIPDHVASLPNGVTVGEWLAERMARSRVEGYR